MTRSPEIAMASAPPAHSAFTTACRSDWCTTSWFGIDARGAGSPAGASSSTTSSPGPRHRCSPAGAEQRGDACLGARDRAVAAPAACRVAVRPGLQGVATWSAAATRFSAARTVSARLADARHPQLGARRGCGRSPRTRHPPPGTPAGRAPASAAPGLQRASHSLGSAGHAPAERPVRVYASPDPAAQDPGVSSAQVEGSQEVRRADAPVDARAEPRPGAEPDVVPDRDGRRCCCSASPTSSSTT